MGIKKQAQPKKAAPKAKPKAATKKKAAVKRRPATKVNAAQGQKSTGFKFPVGNKFWQCRAKHGRNGIWSNPDDLLADCLDYFEWLEQNPLFEDKTNAFQGVVTHEPVAKMRAATLDGLQLHLGISRQTWENYRVKPDFFTVVEYTEKAIRQQKFTGAAADLLNANIIARDLGLKDGINAELTGAGGGPIVTQDIGLDSLDKDERDAIRAILARRAGRS